MIYQIKLIFIQKIIRLDVKLQKLAEYKYHKNFDSKIIAQYMIDKTMGFKSKQKFIWDK